VTSPDSSVSSGSEHLATGSQSERLNNTYSSVGSRPGVGDMPSSPGSSVSSNYGNVTIMSSDIKGRSISSDPSGSVVSVDLSELVDDPSILRSINCDSYS